jgi:hypothetical protein
MEKSQELKKAILEHVKKEYELDGIICIIWRNLYMNRIELGYNSHY